MATDFLKFLVLALLPLIFSYTLALTLFGGIFGTSEFHEMMIEKIVTIGKGGFFTRKLHK